MKKAGSFDGGARQPARERLDPEVEHGRWLLHVLCSRGADVGVRF